MNVRRNKKSTTKAKEQQKIFTSKRGDANSTKQTVMVLGSLGIGNSTVLNQLSGAAAAAPLEARFAA